MKKVLIFTDGSSLGNPGFGGWCAILKYQGNEKILSGGSLNVTNNQMELLAVIKSLNALKEPCDVTITTDSTYVQKGATQWIFNWIKKDFKKVKNPDMWREYLNVSAIHKVKINWVRWHDGHIENERCDTIAKEEATKLKEKRV